jgi:hypothetical protein
MLTLLHLSEMAGPPQHIKAFDLLTVLRPSSSSLFSSHAPFLPLPRHPFPAGTPFTSLKLLQNFDGSFQDEPFFFYATPCWTFVRFVDPPLRWCPSWLGESALALLAATFCDPLLTSILTAAQLNLRRGQYVLLWASASSLSLGLLIFIISLLQSCSIHTYDRHVRKFKVFLSC